MNSVIIEVEKSRKRQNKLKGRVSIKPIKKNIKIVAGGDVAYLNNLAIGGIVALKIPRLEVIEKTFAIKKNVFPYVRGLLAFREAPVLIQAIKKLKCRPDVFIFDGHGIAHPERIGIASHIGVLIDKPTIGCAKSVLIGKFSLPGRKKGSYTFIYDKCDIIGAMLRTKTDIKPVVISSGNKINLEDSMRIVLQCCRTFRIPEPIRFAHIFVNEIKNSIKKKRGLK